MIDYLLAAVMSLPTAICVICKWAILLSMIPTSALSTSMYKYTHLPMWASSRSSVKQSAHSPLFVVRVTLASLHCWLLALLLWWHHTLMVICCCPCGSGSKGSVQPFVRGTQVSSCQRSCLAHDDTPAGHISLRAFQSYWNQDSSPILCSNLITVWRWDIISATRCGFLLDITAT